MNDRDVGQAKDLSNIVGGGAAGAAAALASGASPTAIVLATALGALPQAAASAIGFGAERKARQAAAWWHRVVHDGGDEVTAEEIAAIVTEHREEPFVGETMLRAFRALVDSVDDEATVPIAILTREYLREKRTPDVFFRGAADLLRVVNAAEINDLRRVIRPMHRLVTKDNGGEAHLSVIDEHRNVMRVTPDLPTTGPLAGDKFETPNGPRLIRLLERNDLADDRSNLNTRPSWVGVRLRKDTICSLARILA